MRNEMKLNLQLTRLECCDLLLACTAAKYSANDGGEKWQRLHDKIETCIDEFDTQIDEIVKFEALYKTVGA